MSANLIRIMLSLGFDMGGPWGYIKPNKQKQNGKSSVTHLGD